METKPTYKTAKELGIEQWEHDGLVALVGPLSRGELTFDMAQQCGSVCCIGGWVAACAKREQDTYMDPIWEPHVLWNLYYPDINYSDVTSFHAARAIVNFLVTGDPQWNAVMAEPSQP